LKGADLRDERKPVDANVPPSDEGRTKPRTLSSVLGLSFLLSA
jgi:hypothetical protein